MDVLPAHRLFGPRGRAVAAIADAADVLTSAQARVLADARHPDAGRAWASAQARRLAGAAAPTPDSPPPGSPIGAGLSVIDELVTRQAARHGEAAWESAGPDGQLELGVRPVWTAAGRALIEAAIAYGDPNCPGADRAVLTAVWRAFLA